MNKTRPSVYLVEKCQSLKTVLEFFLSNEGGSFARTVNEKRAVFLSQIDFWDWEIDELCYSVDSFQERSKNWQSFTELTSSLGRLGILIKNGVIDDIHCKRILKERPWNESSTTTTAPIDELNVVIRRWNKLLDVCEDSIMVKEKQLEHAVEMGAQILPNLDKYKKAERKFDG